MNVKRVSILLYAFFFEWMFYFCSGQVVADILREKLVVTGGDLVESNKQIKELKDEISEDKKSTKQLADNLLLMSSCHHSMMLTSVSWLYNSPRSTPGRNDFIHERSEKWNACCVYFCCWSRSQSVNFEWKVHFLTGQVFYCQTHRRLAQNHRAITGFESQNRPARCCKITAARVRPFNLLRHLPSMRNWIILRRSESLFRRCVITIQFFILRH